jgi:hypothetical protein
VLVIIPVFRYRCFKPASLLKLRLNSTKTGETPFITLDKQDIAANRFVFIEDSVFSGNWAK